MEKSGGIVRCLSDMDEQQRTRLVRLCGMLGSAFDGERANAGQMADNLVKSMGTTWDKVIGGGVVYRDRVVYRAPEVNTSTVEGMVSFILTSGILVTAWEEGFLADIGDRSRLSEKQERILRGLFEKAKLNRKQNAQS